MRKIGILIILYNQSIISNITYLSKEYEIIIIDNTKDQDLKINDHNLHYIPLKENLGIAFAQNIGIQKAHSLRCSHIIFLDQDSIIQKGFIQALFKEYERIKIIAPNLFAIGPTPINLQTNKEYAPALKLGSCAKEDFVCKNEIISSGSCIAVADIKKVGLLNESLFIDYVDNEWIWRAAAKGYVSGITKRLYMPHMIGQGDIKLFSYSFRVSSPIRYYYQTRNYLWLCTRKYVPAHWKLSSFVKVLIIPFLLPFHLKNWTLIIKNILRGIKDGLFKRNLYQPNQDEAPNIICSR